ncbi:hypothetical protein ACWAT4_30920 [Bradyrhizobium manausense]
MAGQEHGQKPMGCALEQISPEACPAIGLKKSEYFSTYWIAFFD